MERLTNSHDPSGYQTYSLGSAMPLPHHQPLPQPPPMVKLEAGPPTMSLHSLGGGMPIPSGRAGVVKYCGVCGDIAKSYHFGGLSCDSCKAFFRRSVQNDNYLHFQCCHRGQCLITLSNRKSCQYCRMKRCFGIGMEKSWVMTEEERKALMKARAEKKLSKQLAASATSITTGGKSIYNYSSDDAGSSSSSDYEPQIERMIDFLAPVEIKEIESIVTKYMHAYQHVPYRTELRFFDNDRPGVQVMEMFGTLIRRFAFYARLMADFSSLPFQDQSSLLKGGVLEMCVLRGALVYDPLKNRWPNANMSMYKDAPVLKLDNIGHMTSNRIFQMHMEFINCIQQMGVDEPTIMLLILIVLFTPERAGLIRTKWIEKYQAYYTSLLERYMSWRFGTTRSRSMFGKLLTKLSDLRELSDTHNRQNLQLANDEISSIQHQMQHLKINPYPECKVVPEDSSTPLGVTEGLVGAIHNSCCPVNSSSSIIPTQSYCGAIPETQSVRSCANEPDISSKQSSYYQPQPQPQIVPTQQQQHPYTPQQYPLYTHVPSYQQQPNMGDNNPNMQQQQQQYVPREHTSSTSSYSSSYSDTGSCGTISSSVSGEGVVKGESYHGAYRDQQPQQQQQQPPQTGNMALQFMQAVQNSVQQVVDAPYFGFEWVRPDYHFDPLADDELMESFNSTPPQRNSIPGSVEDPSSPESKSSSSLSSCSGSNEHPLLPPPPNVESQTMTVPTVALTPRTMEELYEALEEYSELYG